MFVMANRNMKPLSLSRILQNVLVEELGFASSEETYHGPTTQLEAREDIEQRNGPDRASKIDDKYWFCEEKISPSASSSASSSSSSHSQVSIDTNDSTQTLSSSLRNPSILSEYEYPRGYFEALMNDAKMRLDEASEFYYSMRTYSFKFEFYISILRDLVTELGTPPRHLPTDDYTKLMKLRHSLRLLEFNLSTRRDLLLQHGLEGGVRREQKKSNLTQGSAVAEEAEAYEKHVICAKISRQRQFMIASLSQKITNLSLKEEQCRQRRLEAEAEFRRYFSDEPITSEPTFQKVAQAPSEPDIIADTSSECAKNKPEKNNFKSKQTVTDFKSVNHQFPSVINTTNRKPLSACTFCNGLHWSHLCLQKPTLEERKRYYRERNMCLMCGRSHRGTCSGGDRWCKWPQCAAKNEHHSAVCPNAEYPILAEHIRAYEADQVDKRSKFSSHTRSRNGHPLQKTMDY